MLLNRDDIKQAMDLPSQIVHIDEWNGDVKVQAMCTRDRIAFEKKNAGSKSELDTMLFLIMYSCVDDNGVRLFNDDDYDLLASKSSNALFQLFQASIALSTLSKQGVEDIAKNS